MAPHSYALRALGIATVIYAAILAVAPIAGIRRVQGLGPAYQAMLMKDPESMKQLADSKTTPEQATQEALRHMVRGAREQAVPVLLLSAVGVLGGALLWLRRRAGPWVVLVFAVWPGLSWIAGLLRRWASHQPAGPAHRPIPIELLGRSIDARTYGAVFQAVFLLVTVGILCWAFVEGRRSAGAERGPG